MKQIVWENVSHDNVRAEKGIRIDGNLFVHLTFVTGTLVGLTKCFDKHLKAFLFGEALKVFKFEKLCPP